MAVRRGRMPLLIVVAGLVGVSGLVGCGEATPSAAPSSPPAAASSPARPSPAASPTPALPGGACRDEMLGGQPVRFGVNGATNLGGVVLGTGGSAVLLAHERRRTLCMWAPYAVELNRAGYRVLAMDLPGSGSSNAARDVALDDAVVAGVALLRSQGAQRVLLVGASMGGTAVLTAAVKVTPPLAGVVGLSAPQRFQGVDAAAAAPRLAVPVLYAACRSDASIAIDAQQLHAATPTRVGARLLIDDCNMHGVSALSVSGIKTEVTRFIKAYAG